MTRHTVFDDLAQPPSWLATPCRAVHLRRRRDHSPGINAGNPADDPSPGRPCDQRHPSEL